MRKASITLCVLAAIVFAAIVAWKIAYPSGSWRYKITVSVETPEGIKTGSAVREIRAAVAPGFLGVEKSLPTSVVGEAVVVDLGERGVLFAIMGVDDYWQFENAFPTSLTWRDRFFYYKNLKNVKTEVAPVNYPRLLAFKDINDPKSVTIAYKPITKVKDALGYQYEVVGVEDNMAELFGSGVSLKNIEIETTNEALTRRVERYLPWLIELKQRRASLNGTTGAVMNNDLANNIGSGSFSAGR